MNAPALELLIDATGAGKPSRLGPAVDPARFLATLTGALGREPTPVAPGLDRLLAELEPEGDAHGPSPLEAPHPALAQIVASLVAAEGRVVRLAEGGVGGLAEGRTARLAEGPGAPVASELSPAAPKSPGAPAAESRLVVPALEARPVALPIDVQRALTAPAAPELSAAPAPHGAPARTAAPAPPVVPALPDVPAPAAAAASHAASAPPAAVDSSVAAARMLETPEAPRRFEPASPAREPLVRAPAPEPSAPERSPEVVRPAPATTAQDAERAARTLPPPRAELPEARSPVERAPNPWVEAAPAAGTRSGFAEDGSSRFGDPPPRGLHAELTAPRPVAHATSEAPQGFSLAAAERAEEAAGRPPVPASRIQEALAAQVERLSQGDGGTARIRLHPQNLGELHLRVRVRGQAVEVTVLAREVAARVLVEGGREHLAEALASRDLRMESFEVHGGPRDEGPAREARSDGARADRDGNAGDERAGDRPAHRRAAGPAAVSDPDLRVHPNLHPGRPPSSDDGRVHWVI